MEAFLERTRNEHRNDLGKEMPIVTTAFDVARYLVQLSFRPDSPEESDLLSHLRLQKLLYYVQGWSLALRKRAVFNDEIEAWTKGPVVPSVYQRLKSFGAKGILPEEIDGPSCLSPSDARLVETVWAEYAKFSAGELIRMTHEEEPWKQARNNLPLNAKSSAPIPKELLADYFHRESAKRAHGPISPQEAWEAIEEFEREAGTPADEVFAEAYSNCPE